MLRILETCKIKLSFDVAAVDGVLQVFLTPCGNIYKRITVFFHHVGAGMSCLFAFDSSRDCAGWSRGEKYNAVRYPLF